MEQWWSQLEREDPEEHARLRRLQEEDPQAFRAAVRDRLQRKRFMSAFRDDPELKKHLMGMPPDARQRLIKVYGKYGPHVMDYVRRHPPNPEIKQIEKQARDLAQVYRAATGEDERLRLREELRVLLEKAFDLKDRERIEHLNRLEEEITRLRDSLRQQQAEREQVIDSQLQALTGQ
jgi:hypothetical protein